MTRRYWALGDLSKRAALQEDARSGMMEAMGLNPDQVANAGRFARVQGHDRAPSLQAGAQGEARVNGESFQILEEHRDGHGDRVLTATRPLGGGRFETISIREAQAEAHTRVTASVRRAR